jgi:hypothetical protein
MLEEVFESEKEAKGNNSKKWNNTYPPEATPWIVESLFEHWVEMCPIWMKYQSIWVPKPALQTITYRT